MRFLVEIMRHELDSIGREVPVIQRMDRSGSRIEVLEYHHQRLAIIVIFLFAIHFGPAFTE